MNKFEKLMGELPPVEQPMSAVEFLIAESRWRAWCASRRCVECDFYESCPQCGKVTPEERVAAMQKWAQKHHEAVQI